MPQRESDRPSPDATSRRVVGSVANTVGGRHRANFQTPRLDWDGDSAHGAGDSKRWLALVVLLVAGFMDLMDVTIVYVALPDMQRDLNAPYVDIEWIVSGYVLGFAALLIIGGRLGDRMGRRRTLMIGLAGFTAASLACGIAGDSTMLISARVVQGAMAGLMIPQILAIMHVTFAPEERAKAFAIWGAVLGAASVAGVLLGGVLVQWNLFGLMWRPIFLVNVPVGLIAVPAVAYFVRESRSVAVSRLDPVGMVLAAAAVLLLLYPLTVGRDVGWPVWTYVMMASSVVVLGAFLVHERHRTRSVGSPLVVLSLFGIRAFSVGMVIWGLFWIAGGGFFLIWTLYLQTGLGWTPLHAGLTAAAFSVGTAVGAGLSTEVLVPRYGRRVLMAGALINGAGFAFYSWAALHFGPNITSEEMLAPLAVTGIGFGLFVAPIVDLVLTDVPAPDAGSASGLLSTMQQLGVAFGVALVAVVFFSHLERESGRAVDTVTPSLTQQLGAVGVGGELEEEILRGFRQCVQDRSGATDPSVIPVSCRSASPPAPIEAGEFHRVVNDAGRQVTAVTFARAFAMTLWYGVGLLMLVFVGVYALPSRMRGPVLAAF